MYSATIPVIVALDTHDPDAALALAARLDPALCRVKVGKELFTAAGPALLDALHDQGHEVFLDLKFHDIPNTVRKAVAVAASQGVWMLTVHASGGRAMMQAAREGAREGAGRSGGRGREPLLVAVTLLTSLDQQDLDELGIQRSMAEQVQRLAALAQNSGMDGVVCSAEEVTGLRTLLREDFMLVTPGIRPAGDSHHDQKRVMTPGEALRAGSNYLVIGRPITRSTRPAERLAAICESL
ncbi:MAG: orotidine-5'-phosphate decarboxylase [Pseudohongiellaceae bacterium]